MGNNPKDEKCNSIFQSSGFYDFVFHKKDFPIDPNIYTIKKNSKVLGEIAKDIKDFTIKSLGVTKADTRGIYESIVECMQNTNNHAYKPEQRYNCWWLMASYDSACEKVNFTFLDNGLTIPTTIAKKYSERIMKVVGVRQDGKMIYSALKGDFHRTSTKEKHRGKGLPKIYATSQKGQIEDLYILSRKGLVNATNKTTEELANRFHGTLLTWSYAKEEGGQCDD